MSELVEKLHSEERPNTPFPLRGNLVGKNKLFGLMVPNVEYTTEGGIITPHTRTHQDKPQVFTLMEVSEVVDEKEFPGFAAYPKNEIFIGPQVLFRQNTGYEWEFPTGANKCEWVIIDAKHAIKCFEGQSDDTTSRMTPEGREDYERYLGMIDKVKDYIEASK